MDNYVGLRGLSAALVMAGLLLPADRAMALWDDRLEIFVAETAARDNNLFRISKDQNPLTVLGSSDRGDTIQTTALGFSLDLPVSRQRFQAGFTWNDVRYDNFSNLDYVGRDGRAVWLWQLGNELHGQLGYTETAALTSFMDRLSTARNILNTKTTYGNASYMLTPSWRLVAALNNQKQSNGDLASRVNDVSIKSAEVIVNYVSAAENQLGISVRTESGDYPNRQAVGATLIDNDYSQDGVGLTTEWALSAKTRLKARVDRVSRSFDNLPQRDFDGTTANAELSWRATEKFSLTAVARREISATEEIRTSLVLVKGFALRPEWDYSDKLRVFGALDYSTRDYLGDASVALGSAPNRVDHLRSIQAGISYRFTPKFSLSLTGQREVRTSNLTFGDYHDNLVTLNARLAF